MTQEIALVTGASRGIGLEVVRQLAHKGMRVVLTARNVEKGESAVKELRAEGLEASFTELDVDDLASVERAVSEFEQQHGQLDVLINNAAAFADWSETPSQASLNHARTVMDTNLFGPWRVIQAFLPLLRKSEHARIVNVASGSGSFGEPQFGLTANPVAASYAISKAALNALTAKLAVELKEQGIIVNATGPGLTATAPGMEKMGARPIPEGAASIVWTAMLAKDGPTGGFFRDGQQLPW
ncbi:MAG: SDR family oxidoreductase [Deinococcota bacterium]